MWEEVKFPISPVLSSPVSGTFFSISGSFKLFSVPDWEELGLETRANFCFYPTESMRCLCWEPSQKFRIHSHRERRFHQGDVTLQKFPTLIFSIYNTPCSRLRSQVSLIKDNFIPKMNFWWHQGSKNYSAVMCNEKNHSLNCILSHSSATSAIFICMYIYIYVFPGIIKK